MKSMAQFTTPPGPRYSKLVVQTRGFELALCAGITAFLAGSAQLDAQELSSAPVPASPSSVSATQADSATLTPICTDRPSKSNYACTVDAGHFQYESDLVNTSSLRQGDETTTIWLILNPTLKYGLTDNLDVEANMTALEILRTQDTPGTSATLIGVSDLYLRVKYEFINLPKVVQAAIIPYLKAPTGRAGIGDGAVDGGLLLPINYEPNPLLTLTLMPEADAYPNSVGAGQHLNTSEVFTLAFNLPRNLTLYTELWADWNLDPARTIRQCSADLALAFGLTDYLQVDGGVNRGLNAATPQVQGYLGLSQKF
jgi:hypothetical protein